MKNYISVLGMFELKGEDLAYTTRDTSINKDSADWKVYPTKVESNQYGLKELQIDLSGAILQGTSNSIEYMD